MKRTFITILILCLLWLSAFHVVADTQDNATESGFFDWIANLFTSQTETPITTPSSTSAIETTPTEIQTSSFSAGDMGNVGEWIDGNVPTVSPVTTSTVVKVSDGSSVAVRPITTNGDVQSAIDLSSVNTATSAGIEISRGGETVRKIVQILPKSHTIVSPDGLTMMQVSETAPVLQIWYGYHTDEMHPFTYFYKVDKIEEPCRVFRVDFAAQTMIGNNVTCNRINQILTSDVIPEWSTLP